MMRMQEGPHAEEDGESQSSLEVRVRDYVAKLETSFHESETLELVASRLRMSPRSFTHYFRTITGYSRQEYLLQLRLRHARTLLAETNDSIASITFSMRV